MRISHPIYTTGARVLTLTAHVLLLFLVASRLGAAAQGIFAHASNIGAILVFVLGSGLETSNTYYISRNQRRYLAPCYISSLLYIAAVSTLCGIALVVLIRLNPAYFMGYPAAFQALLPFLLLGQLLVIINNSVILGIKEYHYYFLSVFLQNIIIVLASIVMMVTNTVTLPIAMGLWVGSFGCPALLQIIIILRSPHFCLSGVRHIRRVLPLQAHYALRTNIGSIAQSLTFRLDALILRLFAPFQVVGTYAVAASVSEAILFVPKGLATYLLSHLSSQRSQLTRAIWRRYLLLLPVLGIFAFTIGWAGGWLPVLLGRSEYIASVPYLRILLVGTVCMGWGMIIASHLNALNRPELVTAASLCALIVTVLGDFLFIPRWQAYGASVVSATAYMLYAGLCARWMVALLRSNALQSLKTVDLLPTKSE